MFAIIGITGQVGGVVAHMLLDANQAVRGIVRDINKGKDWANKGCEIAVTDLTDVNALKVALTGVEGVFVMIPPNFAPSEGFPEAREIISSLFKALVEAKPGKVVCLSTIGAQVTRPNLLNQLHIMEEELSRLPIPIAFIRAAWFMENFSWDVKSAVEHHAIKSYLQPLNQPFPMVATTDIGQLAAALLQQTWVGRRVVELEGPNRVTPNDIAESFAKAVGHSVQIEAVPRNQWENLFKSQGSSNPIPRIQMLDGFNQGWIKFEQNGTEYVKGKISLDTVITQLVSQQSHQQISAQSTSGKTEETIKDESEKNEAEQKLKLADNRYLASTISAVTREQNKDREVRELGRDDVSVDKRDISPPKK